MYGNSTSIAGEMEEFKLISINIRLRKLNIYKKSKQNTVPFEERNSITNNI